MPDISGAATFEATLSKLVFDELDLDLNLLESKLISGDPIIDLSSTSAGLNLASLLDPLAFGNIGKAELSVMTLNPATFTLEIEGSLCHKHSWGSIGDIVTGLADSFLICIMVDPCDVTQPQVPVRNQRQLNLQDACCERHAAPTLNRVFR